MRLTDLFVGMKLPEIKKDVIQENINLYAKASRDFNPIHIDEAFARKTPFGGTIAHGMLILAYISQMMTGAFGRSWLTGGSLNVRFKSPVRPGDAVTVSGAVRHIEKAAGRAVISCDVLCANRKGEAVITGEAKVRFESDEGSR